MGTKIITATLVLLTAFVCTVVSIVESGTKHRPEIRVTLLFITGSRIGPVCLMLMPPMG